MSSETKKVFGLIATFDEASEIYEAAKKVRDAGYKKWDVFTPYPVHGMDAAMGMGRSNVPRFTLIGGILGFFVGCLISWYMNSYDYPLIVGGKPYWSPIYPFPVMYELTILLAAFGTIGGMFVMNMLPMHYHPVFNYEKFGESSDDRFMLVLESKDKKFDAVASRQLLEEIGGKEITEVEG